MKTTYTFKIENPCHQKDWDSMTTSDKGKFCSVCAKNVYDFEQWTDEKIINFLNASDDAICAKLNYSQLNRIVAIPQKSSIKHWHKIVASLLLLISSSTSYAREKEVEQTVKYQLQEKSVATNETQINSNSFRNDSIKNKISGIIIDEDSKNPIPDITIAIKGTDVKTNTDSLGNFALIIPDNFNNDEVTLILIASYGFEGQTERKVYKNELPIENLIIEKPGIMIGEITYYKAKKWWQFWKHR